jgi:DNA-binding SARP family transcriptional activator
MHRLILFGGALFVGPDGPVGGRAAQRHRLALLALLASAHPRPLSRDKMIGLLWPESDADSARHLLRQTLHVLRGTVGEDTLLSSGDDLRIAPERLACDLWDFRDAVEHGDRAAAVRIHAGPLLDGFHLSRAEEFERWMEAERARLVEQYTGALEALAEEQIAAGDMASAANAWRRLAEHDPYHSRYALRLMHTLEATGDRAGVLRHAAIHTALLRDELGVEPDPEVAALTARLREPSRATSEHHDTSHGDRASGRANDDDLPAAEGSRPTAEVATAPPLVRETRSETERPRARWLRYRPIVTARAHMLALASLMLLALLGTLLPERGGQRALALLGIGDGASLLSRGVMAEREPILLADFTSPSGDSVLARIATVAFRVDVAQSPVLRLVDPWEVQAALGRMGRGDSVLLDAELGRELAAREGIKAVLAGEIARTGGGYLLSAQLIAAESGEILAAHRETAGDSTSLLPALDRLSKQLRRRVGESLSSLEASPPLAQVTTSSLAALRKYSQAWTIGLREGDTPRVLALLEEAAALDTAFAAAQMKLAIAYMHQSGRSSRQAEMLTRAYRHRARLTESERYFLLAFYHNWHTWEPEKSVTAMRALLESRPDDAVALNTLSVSYMLVGDYARAEETILRALAIDSSVAVFLINLGNWEFNQGRVADASATFRELERRFPENYFLGYRLVMLAAALGNHSDAERRARAERSAKPEDLEIQLWMAQLLADLASARGRPREAEAFTREAGELGDRLGRPAEHLYEVINFAHNEISLGRPAARALERVEQELERNPLSGLDVYDRPYADLAGLYARAGQPQRARTLLAEWEAAAPGELRRRAAARGRPRMGTALPWVLGEIALAEDRPLEAARQFRRANHPRCLICTLPLLASAHEAAGQPDSAIAAYERFLETPFFGRLHTDAEWRAHVLERLAHLHDARGDHPRAADYYAQFIELWHDADPELQPRVREARRRLAVLGGR